LSPKHNAQRKDRVMGGDFLFFSPSLPAGSWVRKKMKLRTKSWYFFVCWNPHVRDLSRTYGTADCYSFIQYI